MTEEDRMRLLFGALDGPSKTEPMLEPEKESGTDNGLEPEFDKPDANGHVRTMWMTCDNCGAKTSDEAYRSPCMGPTKGVILPSVGRIVHYYGILEPDMREFGTLNGGLPRDVEEERRYYAAFNTRAQGPFAALVVDVGPKPTTVTIKITDRHGKDHVRANVEYGDPGWMWPPRMG